MDPFIGQILWFAGNFAPRSWAFCQGQTMSIAQNTALFSILGTTYGGNGQTTFQLPNFSGRAAIGAGNGPGLSGYALGQAGGSNYTTLTVENLPAHIHTLNGNDTSANNVAAPAGNYLANTAGLTDREYFVGAGEVTPMGAQALGANGGGQAFNNMQPYVGMNFVICLMGIFPSRN